MKKPVKADSKATKKPAAAKSRPGSITVETIAQAMVATSRQPPQASAVYHYPEMTRLAAG